MPNAIQVTQVVNPEIGEGKIYSSVPNGVYGFALHVEDIKEAAAELEELGGKLLNENDFGFCQEKAYQMDVLGGLILELNQYDDALMSGATQQNAIKNVQDNCQK